MSAMAVSGPTARITGRLKGRLAVVAHQARDLQSKQMLGTMDPYAVLAVRSEKIKSQVHTDGGRTPKWEHAFVFNIDCDENEVLHVKVMNKELVTDDTIGVASVAMKDLVIYHQVRRWYQLVDKNNFSKIAGAIELTVDFMGQGVEYVVKVAAPVAAASAPPMPLVTSAAPAPVMPAPSPVAAAAPPVAAPAPTPYYPPISPAAAAPAPAPAAGYYPPPAAAPSPYGYPPQAAYPPAQPAYAPPPQPAYAAPPQPAYGAPPPSYYPPPAAPYGYAPPPQPAYYAPPQPQPQVVYAAPPQPTVVYQQPRPEVVIIEERPLFW